jgi:hypothetical protein
MKIKAIYDNGGKTLDRYEVVYDAYCGDGLYEGVGMSEHPFHPQGFGQHGEVKPGRHLGKRIKFEDLPADCQKLVMSDLMEASNG